MEFLDLSLINCKIELDLLWTKDCALIENHNNITEVNFIITSTKLNVPVVTLSINDNINVFRKYKAFKDLKQQFLGTNVDLK